MTLLLTVTIYFALLAVGLSMLLCTLCLLRGPSAQDRILALDTLWICAMLLCLLLGLYFGSYRRVVHLAQIEDPAIDAAAQAAADRLGLPLERRFTGLSGLDAAAARAPAPTAAHSV